MMDRAMPTQAAVPTPVKLALLWASVTLCYLYCDYFELYVPGKLSGMLAGQMQPLGPVTQQVLLGAGALLLVPCLMVALSVLLPPRAARWANVVAGAAYTALMALFVVSVGWHFYRLYAFAEAVLTATIVWQAWSWRATARAA